MLPYKALLLVDDDVEDHEIFIEVIQEVDSSIHCICRNESENVLNMLQEGYITKPDIIFLDLNMPLVNGKQLLAQLKSVPDLSDIPIIMYSTHFEESDVVEINKLGAAYHLVKPSRFSELRDALTYILKTAW